MVLTILFLINHFPAKFRPHPKKCHEGFPASAEVYLHGILIVFICFSQINNKTMKYTSHPVKP